MTGLENAIHALVIVALLFLGSDMSATGGREARELRLPFAWLTFVTPIIAAGLYIIVGLLSRRTRLGRWGWVVAYCIGGLVAGSPSGIISAFAQPIQLTRWLSADELSEVSARFQHPHLEYSASSEGTVLLIRRRDYDPSLVAYLVSIHATPSSQDRPVLVTPKIKSAVVTETLKAANH